MVGGEPRTDTRAAEVRHYLESAGARTLPDHRIESVEFLARGEYSLNYLVCSMNEPGDEHSLVARLVTGTQMDLPLGEQALYEHHALELLVPSGVTPEPHYVDPDPEGLPYPLILEEYLPGRPLSYATDLKPAARCVAKIHALAASRDHLLQEHPDPAPSILAESRQLVTPYLDWKQAPQESKEALHGAFRKIEQFLEQKGLFSKEDLVIVNYDLNTHNFIVSEANEAEGNACLVDWEKARIAPRTQDIAHFLLPTTTLWRDATATRLTLEQETEFVNTYLSYSNVGSLDRFLTQLAAMRLIVSLRAVSWCAWALRETTHGDRVIINEETLNKSRTYLQPEFLWELFRL